MGRRRGVVGQRSVSGRSRGMRVWFRRGWKRTKGRPGVRGIVADTQKGVVGVSGRVRSTWRERV